jgi:hypothetical protein
MSSDACPMYLRYNDFYGISSGKMLSYFVLSKEVWLNINIKFTTMGQKYVNKK